MADSVREQIMKNVQATLEAITVENGYQHTLRSVQRFQQGGQQLSAVPVAVLIEGGDDVELEGPLSGSFSLTSRMLTVSVVIIHRQDLDTDARSASELMNTIISDVQTAMQVDHTRGGLALDTNEAGIGEMDVEDGQPELVQTIGYRIQYRHRRTDPTIAG